LASGRLQTSASAKSKCAEPRHHRRVEHGHERHNSGIAAATGNRGAAAGYKSDLPVDLSRCQRRRLVGGIARVNDLRAVHRARDAVEIGREVIGSHHEWLSVRSQPRVYVNGARYKWHGLKERPVVAGRLEVKAPHFTFDVRCALEPALVARASPHHRVVGEYVQPRHRVGGGNRGSCGLRRVLERERRLRETKRWRK